MADLVDASDLKSRGDLISTVVTANRLSGAFYTIPLVAVGEDGSEATCTVTFTPVAGL